MITVAFYISNLKTKEIASILILILIALFQCLFDHEPVALCQVVHGAVLYIVSIFNCISWQYKSTTVGTQRTLQSIESLHTVISYA